MICLAYGPQLGRRLRLSYSEQNFVGLSGNCVVGPLTDRFRSTDSRNPVGGYVSGPPLGKLADSRGPRLCLALAFLLLLSGYLGIKAVFDGSEDDTRPVGNGTLFTLVLSEFLTGVGSNAGFSAALNTVLRSFPDKIVSSYPGSLTPAVRLTLVFMNAADDCLWAHRFRFRIVRLSFFRHRPHFVSREHFQFPTHSSGRNSRPNGTRLVPRSSLPIPRTHNTNDLREQRSGGVG